MQTVHMSLCCQEPPDGGRTHLQEESSGLLIDREMPMGDQVLHEESHACCSFLVPRTSSILSSFRYFFS